MLTKITSRKHCGSFIHDEVVPRCVIVLTTMNSYITHLYENSCTNLSGDANVQSEGSMESEDEILVSHAGGSKLGFNLNDTSRAKH
jgi:hypothetical protein